MNFGIEIVTISKFPKATLLDKEKIKRITDEIINTLKFLGIKLSLFLFIKIRFNNTNKRDGRPI
jgi:hypothetical protein